MPAQAFAHATMLQERLGEAFQHHQRILSWMRHLGWNPAEAQRVLGALKTAEQAIARLQDDLGGQLLQMSDGAHGQVGESVAMSFHG
jgi:hypothetical protein